VPVLVWDLSEAGPVSTVETDWPIAFTPEERREEAEVLDRQLDGVLDETLTTVDRLEKTAVASEFVRAWAIGSVLSASGVLDAPAMKNEPRQRLWLALARKCRNGMRSDGSVEARWEELRPSAAREPRREGGRLDHFELCLWLASQEFEAAGETFGGSVRNAWQMLERPALRPLIVRTAFHRWLGSLDPELRRRAVDLKVFPELMKALRRRWPDRGAGSAKRPIHYSESELTEEMDALLRPLLEQGGSEDAS
jgi:hypothetical protein